jgi:hypothetical protein
MSSQRNNTPENFLGCLQSQDPLYFLGKPIETQFKKTSNFDETLRNESRRGDS